MSLRRGLTSYPTLKWEINIGVMKEEMKKIDKDTRLRPWVKVTLELQTIFTLI